VRVVEPAAAEAAQQAPDVVEGRGNRKRVAVGEPQSKGAAHFRISTGLCCQIIKAEI
jgi:hypothetical protein